MAIHTTHRGFHPKGRFRLNPDQWSLLDNMLTMTMHRKRLTAYRQMGYRIEAPSEMMNGTGLFGEKASPRMAISKIDLTTD